VSLDEDRRTPRELFNRLDAIYRFDLDAAASAENALCDDYCTIERCGLAFDWAGRRVFWNPPYSQLPQWVAKAFLNSKLGMRKGDCLVSVGLFPANRTEQPFWHEYIEPYRDRGMGVSTRFIKGRPRFGYPDHVKTKSNGQSPKFGVVAVAFFGNEVAS